MRPIGTDGTTEPSQIRVLTETPEALDALEGAEALGA